MSQKGENVGMRTQGKAGSRWRSRDESPAVGRITKKKKRKRFRSHIAVGWARFGCGGSFGYEGCRVPRMFAPPHCSSLLGPLFSPSFGYVLCMLTHLYSSRWRGRRGLVWNVPARGGNPRGVCDGTGCLMRRAGFGALGRCRLGRLNVPRWSRPMLEGRAGSTLNAGGPRCAGIVSRFWVLYR